MGRKTDPPGSTRLQDPSAQPRPAFLWFTSCRVRLGGTNVALAGNRRPGRRGWRRFPWRHGGIQTWFVYGKSHEKRWFGGRPMTSETSKWSSDQVHFKVENNRAWRAISINSLLSYACMLGLGGPHPWWNRWNCDCFGAGSGMNQQL